MSTPPPEHKTQKRVNNESSGHPGSPAQNNDPRAGQDAPQDSRDTDANVLQRRASTPKASVWVSASAGTGKTKVLTDRVLRLLLPRDDGGPGTAAHKILCLTFTKAAASEMALRISKTLARWAVIPLEKYTDKDGKKQKGLIKELDELFGRAPKHEEIEAARLLFAKVIDVPGGLKIMTIHAFCQSVLGRFPLEAGISPHFDVLEEAQSETLMQRARANIFARAEKDPAAPRSAALHNIASAINEDQFQELLGTIARERSQLQRLLEENFDIDGLYTAICQHLQIKANQDPQELLRNACEDSAFDKDALLMSAQTMNDIGTKTDKKHAQRIFDWLAASPNQRVQLFEEYKSAFVTQDKKKRLQIKKTLAYTDVCNANANIPEILLHEAERIMALIDTMNASQSAALTRDLLLLGQDVLDEYNALKTNQGALDFDDLVLQTKSLLDQGDMSGWVHFKLDEGLDHILVDEAQDTNPEQWKIVEKLCSDFFSGQGISETDRTVFIVGDEKQSIYSFQRASPAEFQRMQNDFEKRVNDASLKWDAVPMNISFRSVKSVLETVDAVFTDPLAAKGLGNLEIKHTAHRRGQAGLVELWPVCEHDESIEADLWTPLKDPADQHSSQKKLALHIAQTVKSWIENKEELPSHGRPITAGDIMILVRTRSKLVAQIARELKNAGIAVSGLDRMVLGEELAVQDLLAAANFALQPLDDLNLACLLKSPLIGADEDTLYKLAIDRNGQSLWERTRALEPEIAAYLSDLQHQAKSHSPFGFLSHLLRAPCPDDTAGSGRRAFMARLGKDAMDPIDELLNLARQYEQNEAATLQGFLQAQNAQNAEIKREQHGESDEVRIMTIHGSKGLQAPIVVLPDTIGTPAQSAGKADKRLLWPHQSDLNVPLWSPRKDMDYKAYTEAMAALDDKFAQEYRRLLYVAMTRAEDRLYIGGALNKTQKPDNLPDNCWYTLIKNGLSRLNTLPVGDSGAVRLTNKQSKDPDRATKTRKADIETRPLPDWLREKAKPETAQSAIYRPSRGLETATSPLKNAGTQRFLRGNITHKLLQLLPEIAAEKRKTAAESFLNRYESAFDAQKRTEIIQETLDILEKPEFSALFSAGSQAEIPITGYIEGKGLISGQIDRLCVTKGEILIVDYKTNRPPPTEEHDVPAIYREQMQTYAAVLSEIYPRRTIKAYLLWTDGAILMPLDL